VALAAGRARQAHVVVGDLGFAPDLAMGVVRDADAAGIGNPFQARGDVDAIAENIVVIDDDVADVDADAEFDPLDLWDVDIAGSHAALDLDRAAHGVDGAAELDQHAVAGRLDDAAAILGDLGVDQRLAAGFQAGEGSFFIASHQPAVAGNIGGQDCREASVNPGTCHTAIPPHHARSA
jgi:hypothetical protein